MNITKLNIVPTIIVVLCSLFLFGVIFNVEYLTLYSRGLILPFFVYLYFTQSKPISKYFAGFLIACSLGEIFKILVTYDFNFFNKLSHVCYVLGYLYLIIYMLKSISFKRLIKLFLPHLIVLSLFNIYIVYIIIKMLHLDNTINVFTPDFALECTYNLSVLLILSLSLLHYLYHDNKRGLLLFLVSAIIVFSEMVQVAYIFIPSDYILNVIYSILLVTGFYIVYVYITSKISKHIKVLF